MADAGSFGCNLIGNEIIRQSDRAVVASFDHHADAVDFYLDSARLRARLDEVALADKVEAELHLPPVQRKVYDPL